MRDWLVKIRTESGKSQYAVARQSGLSQSYYALIETGDRGTKLPVETAKRIADALGFSWQRFYDENSASK